ncbi:glycoside hydrolase family 55 protein [Oxynema aestuarii]|nr:glycoside hydrolase family 55 protein [Oxynema aestuarii]
MMYSLWRRAGVAIAIAVSAGIGWGVTLDRDDRAIAAPLPADAAVTNVRDYGAKGDGVSDDTAAIQTALEEGNRFLYFPDGTYLVCDTLTIAQTGKRYFFEGESRDRAIVRLKDNCPGFDNPEAPKPVIQTKGPAGQAFRNSLFDLTVDVGRGNPGAIAIEYLNNNQGTIRNVTVRSSDPQKYGFAGIALTLPWPGPGTIEDVAIFGFDRAVLVTFPEFGMVFENLHVEDQRLVGIENRANLLSIRGLTSRNRVPAIRNVDGRGLVVVLDSQLEGGSPDVSAIANDEGVLYARNIRTSGYRSAIANSGEVIAGDRVDEYSSHGIYSLFPSTGSSLNLAIEAPPETDSPPVEQWVSVANFGADGNDDRDDTAAIQEAIDSGAAIVYFPNGKYIISNTIELRGNLERLNLLESTITVSEPLNGTENPVFRLQDGPSKSVILERFWGNYGGRNFHWVEHASSRTLVLKNIAVGSAKAYRNSGSGKLFIKDMVASDWIFKNQQVWARQLNPEGDVTKIINDGSDLWILGLKTEDEGNIIQTLNGGKTEVLGGLIYPGSGDIPPDQAAFINRESDLSVVIAESHHGGTRYTTFVRETRNGVTKTLTDGQLPPRGSARFIPLYVGTPGSVEPVLHSLLYSFSDRKVAISVGAIAISTAGLFYLKYRKA